MRAAGMKDLVDELESEHQKVKELVARLERLEGPDEVDPILAELKADVEHA